MDYKKQPLEDLETLAMQGKITVPDEDLNPIDELGALEAAIRSDGEWCDVTVSDKIAHRFICRNPKSTLAISLCGQIVKPIEKLNINHVSKKCLVCSLYNDTGKETKQLLQNRLNDIVGMFEKEE